MHDLQNDWEVLGIRGFEELGMLKPCRWGELHEGLVGYGFAILHKYKVSRIKYIRLSSCMQIPFIYE